MSYSATFDGEAYVAPYPPRPSRFGPLTVSAIAAVVAINMAAGLFAWRELSLSDLDTSDKGAGIPMAVILPKPQPPTRLAVLDPPQYLPAGKYVPVKAELTGYEAASVIDAIDPGVVAVMDGQAPDNNSDDGTAPSYAMATPEDAIPPTPDDGTGEPADPHDRIQPAAYTIDETPANAAPADNIAAGIAVNDGLEN